MNERVKAFLEQKGVEASTTEEVNVEVSEKEKQDLLRRVGLYDKVYSPEKFYTDEYPKYDCTVFKYYKEIPIDITDDEYFAIKKAVDGHRTNSNVYMNESVYTPADSGCAVATALQVFAWIIFFGGFFAGIFLANKTVDVGGYYYSRSETKFMWSVALTYWCTAAVSGTLFLGFAEIIKLLEAIKNK